MRPRIVETSSDFWSTRKDFLDDLRFTRGAAGGTCVGYASDLKLWGEWLEEVERDWHDCSHVQVEQWIAWQTRERKVKPHIIARRVSCLSTFYKWAKKRRLVANDPVYLADKPRRPKRLPIWLDAEEQTRLHVAAADIDDLPDNLYGNARARILDARRRHAMLFTLILHSGLRISEALALQVRDVRVTQGIARTVQVIGKGDKERLVPLPEGFGQMFGVWLEGLPKDAFVFAKGVGQPPPTVRAAAIYLNRLVERAAIDKRVTPHKLRHTYATRLLESGAQLVDIQALLGHASLSTTQIYTHVTLERMAGVVEKL
jgi:integrase/recombinase XerD